MFFFVCVLVCSLQYCLCVFVLAFCFALTLSISVCVSILFCALCVPNNIFFSQFDLEYLHKHQEHLMHTLVRLLTQFAAQKWWMKQCSITRNKKCNNHCIQFSDCIKYKIAKYSKQIAQFSFVSLQKQQPTF